MRVNFELTWKRTALVGALAILLIPVFVYLGLAGKSYVTAKPSFCHSCHAMDEPFDSWQVNAHSAINESQRQPAVCLDCHIAPGEEYSLVTMLTPLRHTFAYLVDPDAPLPIRAKIEDSSCLRSGCHSKDKFQDEKITFAGVKFQHRVHFEDTKYNSSALSCDNCHSKVSEKEHFEVAAQICILCHLQPTKPAEQKVELVSAVSLQASKQVFKSQPAIDFKNGLSKCESCHTIPTKSLQEQVKEGDKDNDPITHQSLEKRGVPCNSCHIDIARGAGEINTGNVDSGGCLKCHNSSESLLADVQNVSLMHDKHIKTKRADCFECHEPIEHGNLADEVEYVSKKCDLCHAEPHINVKSLLVGHLVDESLAKTPHLMDAVNTNCMACHIKKDNSQGHPLMLGSDEACEGCHTEAEKDMVGRWKEQLKKEIMFVQEIEQEALQAIAEAKNKNKNKLVQAQQMIAKGQQLLEIVRTGNGVHNKKYSMMILDKALTYFEDVVDLIGKEG